MFLLGYLLLPLFYYLFVDNTTNNENNATNNDIKDHSKAFYDGLAGKPFKCYYDGIIVYDELEDLDLIVYIHKDDPWSNKYINNLKNVNNVTYIDVVNDKNKDEYKLLVDQYTVPQVVSKKTKNGWIGFVENEELKKRLSKNDACDNEWNEYVHGHRIWRKQLNPFIRALVYEH